LPPEPSPEEHEAALLQLAQGLIAIARVWRDGARPPSRIRTVSFATSVRGWPDSIPMSGDKMS
jgi:hypothetical protein